MSLSAYVRWVSSAYVLGWEFDKQLGKSLIYKRNSEDPSIVFQLAEAHHISSVVNSLLNQNLGLLMKELDTYDKLNEHLIDML